MSWLTLRTTLPPRRPDIASASGGSSSGWAPSGSGAETLVKRFGIKDQRVNLIAEIVHEADLHDGKFTRHEAAGVDLAISALAASTPDDHELLERGMTIFHGLHTVLKRKTQT